MGNVNGREDDGDGSNSPSIAEENGREQDSMVSVDGIYVHNRDSGDGDGDGDDEFVGQSPPSSPRTSQSPLMFRPQMPVDPLPIPDGMHVSSPSWMQISSGYEEMYYEPGFPNVFTWSYGGRDISLEGSWDNWKIRTRLESSGKDLTIVKVLPSGFYHYRFIVDGQWRHTPDKPWIQDEAEPAKKNLSFPFSSSRSFTLPVRTATPFLSINSPKVTVKERRRNMNRCVYQYQQQQQKAAALVGFGYVAELRRGENCSNSFSMANTNGVVCPKPRRVVDFNDSFSIRSSSNQQMEACESKAGIDLLDIIRTKGDHGVEKSSFQVALSPPFYSGSPPVRASNPLIQDEQFGNEKLNPLSPPPPRSGSPPSSRLAGGGGRVRLNYRHNQPPVRVEGFNCSVYAIA